MEATDGIFSLFPFVCGICNAKFNGIANYFSHVQDHKVLDGYLHCCVKGSKPSEAEHVYTCGKCQLVFPSLCTLYKHIMEDEKITEFLFRSQDKTAYEVEEQNDSQPLVRQRVNVSQTNEHVDVGVGMLDDGSELCNYNDNRCNSSQGVSMETQQTCQVRTNETLLNKKKLDIVCKEENETSEIDVCDNEQDMDDSADHFTESSKPSSHEVPAKKVKRVGKGHETDSYYPCEVCGGIYKYHALQCHKAVHAKRTFQCDQCELKFSSKARLSQHKNVVHVTENKYTCHECGKSFKALPYLRQHGKKHWKERTAECQLCHKKFKDQKAIRVHMVSHSEERPHKCTMCDKSFKRLKDLQGHVGSVHTTVENYQCTECHKMFKTRSAVNKHRLIHKPPKHFCDVCGKSFVQHSNMRIHMKVHSKGV